MSLSWGTYWPNLIQHKKGRAKWHVVTMIQKINKSNKTWSRESGNCFSITPCTFYITQKLRPIFAKCFYALLPSRVKSTIKDKDACLHYKLSKKVQLKLSALCGLSHKSAGVAWGKKIQRKIKLHVFCSSREFRVATWVGGLSQGIVSVGSVPQRIRRSNEGIIGVNI